MLLAMPQSLSKHSRFTIQRIELLKTLVRGNGTTPSLIDLLKSNRIQWQIELDGPCNSANEKHADGAFSHPNKVCISAHNLTRFEYPDLSLNIVALFGHEFGHMYFGDDEAKPDILYSFFMESGQDLIDPDRRHATAVGEKLDDFIKLLQNRLHRYRQEDVRAFPRTFKEPGDQEYFKKLETFAAFFDEILREDRLFFPPEFLRKISSGRQYAHQLSQRVADAGLNYADFIRNPDSYYHFNVVEAILPELQSALQYWREFYHSALVEKDEGASLMEFTTDKDVITAFNEAQVLMRRALIALTDLRAHYVLANERIYEALDERGRRFVDPSGKIFFDLIKERYPQARLGLLVPFFRNLACSKVVANL